MDAAFGEDKIGVIGLGNEDHVTGLVSDYVIGVCGQVVEDNSGFDVGDFVGGDI